jgi:hypothetical protein
MRPLGRLFFRAFSEDVLLPGNLGCFLTASYRLFLKVLLTGLPSFSVDYRAFY